MSSKFITMLGLEEPQLEQLSQSERLAFFPPFSLSKGELLEIWWETKAERLYAYVEEVVEKPSIADLERLLPLSGYSTIDEWLAREEERLGGSLPRIILVLRLLDPKSLFEYL